MLRHTLHVVLFMRRPAGLPALGLADLCQAKMADCDRKLKAAVEALTFKASGLGAPLPKARLKGKQVCSVVRCSGCAAWCPRYRPYTGRSMGLGRQCRYS